MLAQVIDPLETIRSLTTTAIDALNLPAAYLTIGVASTLNV
jgi:hypothetical protein